MEACAASVCLTACHLQSLQPMLGMQLMLGLHLDSVSTYCCTQCQIVPFHLAACSMGSSAPMSQACGALPACVLGSAAQWSPTCLPATMPAILLCLAVLVVRHDLSATPCCAADLTALMSLLCTQQTPVHPVLTSCTESHGSWKQNVIHTIYAICPALQPDCALPM